MTTIKARIDDDVKQRAAAALSKMDLTMSDAIRILMRRIADEGQMPFEIRIPNAVTREAIVELEAGKGNKASSIADMMAQLNADD